MPTHNKLTKHIINERIADRGIELIGDFTATRFHSLFKCTNDHEWMARPNSILMGTSCPECSPKALFTAEIVNERIAQRGIRLHGEYLGARTYTTFICSAGHIWSQPPMKIMSGKGCPHCAGNAKLSQAIVNEKLKDCGITMLGEYINSHTISLFRCEDGHEWQTSPTNVLRTSGCPHCADYGFNPSKPAYAYLLDYGDFIKYGITNSLMSRLRNHRYKNGDFTVIATRLYEHGTDALRWENYIKTTLGGKYATRERCPDGYTETLHPSLTETMKKYFPL